MRLKRAKFFDCADQRIVLRILLIYGRALAVGVKASAKLLKFVVRGKENNGVRLFVAQNREAGSFPLFLGHRVRDANAKDEVRVDDRASEPCMRLERLFNRLPDALGMRGRLSGRAGTEAGSFASFQFDLCPRQDKVGKRGHRRALTQVRLRGGSPPAFKRDASQEGAFIDRVPFFEHGGTDCV